MNYLARKIQPTDFPNLETLLKDYYQGNWRGKIEKLKEDSVNGVFEISVAESGDGNLAGFLVWTLTYDLNWCLKGAEVIDFYVSPKYRGRGAALLLIIEMARETSYRGGSFLKGGSANTVVHRTFARIAMKLHDSEFYLSGRAFRHLAELAGKDLREVVRNLPDAAWNQEP